jgi:hypothetical protein
MSSTNQFLVPSYMSDLRLNYSTKAPAFFTACAWQLFEKPFRLDFPIQSVD